MTKQEYIRARRSGAIEALEFLNVKTPQVRECLRELYEAQRADYGVPDQEKVTATEEAPSVKPPFIMVDTRVDLVVTEAEIRGLMQEETAADQIVADNIKKYQEDCRTRDAQFVIEARAKGYSAIEILQMLRDWRRGKKKFPLPNTAMQESVTSSTPAPDTPSDTQS